MPWNSLEWTYLVEMVLGVCCRGIRGGEKEYGDTENSPVDSGLSASFCEWPSTAEKCRDWFKWWFRGSKPLTLCAKCHYICIFSPHLQFLSDSQRQTRLSWSQAATSQPEDPTVVAPCPRFSQALRHMKLNYLEPNRNMRLSFLTDSSASEPPKCHSFLISREANCSNL